MELVRGGKFQLVLLVPHSALGEQYCWGFYQSPWGNLLKGEKILFFTLLLEVFFSSSSSTDASNSIEKQNRENRWYYDNGNSKYISLLNLDLKPTCQKGSPQRVDG